MVLSFTFYRVDEKKPDERVYLQSTISEHVIWKTLDFWECSIFESIKEELENQRSLPTLKNEKPNEAIIREKNTIFSQLASYAHNMLMFGLDPGLVKELMTKFGKSYNLFELQIKDLYVNSLLLEFYLNFMSFTWIYLSFTLIYLSFIWILYMILWVLLEFYLNFCRFLWILY